jgi:predicted peptidase
MEAARFSPPSTLDPLPYRIFKPKGLREKAPLIVYLHGSDGRGNDNISQLGPELEVLLSERVQQAGPAFVLVPQCPSGDKWANRYASPPLRPYDLSALPESRPSRSTVALIGELVGRYPIDPNRIYLMGFSMGGSGTWDMLMRHPDVFAAGVPITGVADVGRASLLASIPVWSFHGELDDVSPVENGRMMFEALRKQGGPARYTELKGVAHGSVGTAFGEPGLFPWLFAQRRPDKPSEQN